MYSWTLNLCASLIHGYLGGGKQNYSNDLSVELLLYKIACANGIISYL